MNKAEEPVSALDLAEAAASNQAMIDYLVGRHMRETFRNKMSPEQLVSELKPILRRALENQAVLREQLPSAEFLDKALIGWAVALIKLANREAHS